MSEIFRVSREASGNQTRRALPFVGGGWIEFGPSVTGMNLSGVSQVVEFDHSRTKCGFTAHVGQTDGGDLGLQEKF